MSRSRSFIGNKYLDDSLMTIRLSCIMEDYYILICLCKTDPGTGRASGECAVECGGCPKMTDQIVLVFPRPFAYTKDLASFAMTRTLHS